MEAGGAQKVAFLLHRGFQELGDSSQLWFLYTKRAFYKEDAGVQSLLPHSPSLFDYVRISVRLFRKLRESRPDVLITHTHYANVLGQLIALLAGVPVRIAVHHNPLPTYPRLARIADCFLGQCGVYSKIVAVSDAVVATLQSYPRSYARRLTRIHNGISTISPSSQDIRSILGIPASQPLLVNVGRISRQKNQATLLRALLELQGAHLLIIGDGELSQDLHAQATSLGVANRVHFTGEIPAEDVAACLKSADLFVFPSLWESMGLAVLEAMHSGLPVVASDIPALRELLGDAALFVSPTDASALAAAVKRVISDLDLADTLRSQSRRRAAAFSLENMVGSYRKLIAD